MKTKAVRYLRAALLILIFVLTFASFSSAPRLQAQTRSGSEFDYYSDDTFTQQVGAWIFCSDGSSFSWGTRTSYVIVVDSGC